MLSAQSPPAPSPALSSQAAPRADSPPERALLLQALMLGVSADAFLRDGPIGPGLAAWVAILALATLALTWRAGRRMPREAQGWLATAIIAAAMSAWRDTGALQALDLLVVLGSLGMAAIALRDVGDALWAPRLRDTVWAGMVIVRSTARGVVPLAMRQLLAADRSTASSGRAQASLRAALIAGALLVVFGSLLRSADPIFARLVAIPELDFGAFLSHAIVVAAFTWITGGWAYGALLAEPGSHRAPDRPPITLGTLDVTTGLVTLNVLFGAFMLTQLGWFFGGERFLHATTGLSAADYARQGFFQMVWVVLLVLALLLATRAALRPDPTLARRHTLLSLPVVALLGAIVLSAALRMRLYVHHFGLTTDRLYTLVFMGWLAVVLVLLTATVLRGRGRRFVGGSVLSGLSVLLALHLAVPDRLVARVNLARAASADDATRRLDLPHLASLSGDAADLAIAAVLRASPDRYAPTPGVTTDGERCRAATELLMRWGPSSPSIEDRAGEGAWRRWNAGEAHALRVVGANAAQLRSTMHEACAAARAAPPRTTVPR